jgi:PKD repeat protein
MVVMPDGKFVVVGTATLTDAALKSVVLARFTTDDPEPEPEVNHDPVATLTAPTSGVRGFALSFLGMFSDEDLSDTHMVSWDFGDGTVIDFQDAASALEAVHTYAASGQYTVTFTVKDQHGATSSATAVVSIGSTGVSVDPVTGVKTLQVGGGLGSDSVQVKTNKKGELVLMIGGVSAGTFNANKLVIDAGAGDDAIVIGKHVKVPIEIHAGDGNDILHAGGGNATLLGGKGNDKLFGGHGINHLEGGEGNDFLHVPVHNEHAAVLMGGAGNDHLTGGGGDDMLEGGDGNDHLHGRKGNDVMNGGLGKDHYDHKGADVITDPDMVIKKKVKAAKAKLKK